MYSQFMMHGQKNIKLLGGRWRVWNDNIKMGLQEIVREHGQY